MPCLNAHIDLAEMERRQRQREEDVEIADTLLLNPPEWADKDAFVKAWHAVTRYNRDPAVWRTERIAQALFLHVVIDQRLPRIQEGEVSARVVAIREYDRARRVHLSLRAVSIACRVVLVAGVLLGIAISLFCTP